MTDALPGGGGLGRPSVGGPAGCGMAKETAPMDTAATRTVRRRHAPRRAFTLLESMLALLIIGVGVLAFVEAQTSFTRSNNWSSHAATGMLLANEVREMTRRFPRHDPVTGLSLGTAPGGGQVVTGWGREPGETTVYDFDDLDDLDGVTFGMGGNFPGPVDAQGNLLQRVDDQGMPVLDGEGNPVALEGWRQRVLVTKVDPYNFSTARGPAYEQVASGLIPAIRVDQFPLRVTVIVEYQGLSDTRPEEITRLTWIVPP